MKQLNFICCLVLLLLTVNLVLGDSEMTQVCGGDEELIIMCVGDLQNTPLEFDELHSGGSVAEEPERVISGKSFLLIIPMLLVIMLLFVFIKRKKKDKED